MKPYRYLKTFPPEPKPVSRWQRPTFEKRAAIGVGLVLAGVGVLGSLATFYSDYALQIPQAVTSDPLVRSKTSFGVLGANVTPEPALIYRNFYLSVPALKIDKAVVTTNVESSKQEAYFPVLEESIAHYKNTSLPGQKGDSFLYGHSVLPRFFNKNDYMTIFSNLHKLKAGDRFTVNYGPDTFTYEVFKKEIVESESLDVINTTGEGDSTMTLMTCTPPGTYLKRLVVTGKLIK